MNTFRRLLAFTLLLQLSPSAFSQAGDKRVAEDNLYPRALFASLDKMAKSWGGIEDGVRGSRMRTDYHNMIVEEHRDITEGLPTQSGEYRVEYLDTQGLIDRYKKLRKPFAILVARPMQNEGERLKISYTIYWFEYKKGGLIYSLSDWSNVYFRYDCAKREFVIDDVKLGGI